MVDAEIVIKTVKIDDKWIGLNAINRKKGNNL